MQQAAFIYSFGFPKASFLRSIHFFMRTLVFPKQYAFRRFAAMKKLYDDQFCSPFMKKQFCFAGK